jgi:DNA-binding SARP family transcriptional activator
MELLWPDHPVTSARHSLSTALSWLRRQLEGEAAGAAALPADLADESPPAPEAAAIPPPGPAPSPDSESGVLLADYSAIRLNPAAVTTDVGQFNAALQAAAGEREEARRAAWLAGAVELYRGELLPGCFEEWVLQERRWLAERFFQALGELLPLLERAGQLDRAVQYAQAGVRADPLREEAHRDLMRLYAATGQPVAGLQQYGELQRLLEEGLGVTPDAATRALARELEGRVREGRHGAADPDAELEPGQLSVSPPAVTARVALLYRRHAEPDEGLLKLLEARLAARGHRVFVDRHLSIGVEWAREIEREIREADAVIPLLSTAAVQSEMLAYEIETAHEAARQQDGRPRLLPIRVAYTGALPEPLAVILDPLEYSLWQGPDDTGRVVLQLLRALESLESGARSEEAPAGAPPGAAPGLSRTTEPDFRPAIPLGRPPGGVLPVDSPLYVLRSEDREFEQAIRNQESIVLIRGPRQVGKTSLLARGLQQAREAGCYVTLTDFQSLDAGDLDSVEQLYAALAERVAEDLELEVAPEAARRAHLGAAANFQRYLQREVLGRLDAPLVWGLDEVDRLFPCEWSGQVFALFRSWHNRRGLDPGSPWSRLTLAIAFAGEAHLFISDLNQSPFNVGVELRLGEFTVAQVAELNERYGSPLQDQAEVLRFHTLVAGHPHLVSRGLWEMASGSLNLDQFCQSVDRDEGVYGDHLRRLLATLVKEPALSDLVCALLRGAPARGGRASTGFAAPG